VDPKISPKIFTELNGTTLLILVNSRGLVAPLEIKDSIIYLSGIMVAPSALMVSHLLFADDILMFFNANRDSGSSERYPTGVPSGF
jgi:hypothetical protein